MRRSSPRHERITDAQSERAGEVLVNGQRLFVVVAHAWPHQPDQPLFGRHQPPTRLSEIELAPQMRALRLFTASLLALDPTPLVAVVGDFASLPFAMPLRTLAGEVLVNLTDTLPEAKQYTTIGDGNAQALDHVLVSPALQERVAEYDVVHLVAEFPGRITDHDPVVARFNLKAPTPTSTPALDQPNLVVRHAVFRRADYNGVCDTAAERVLAVTLANTGAAHAGSFTVAVNNADRAEVAGLPPGAEITVAAGDWRLYMQQPVAVVVDRHNSVAESDEEDNIWAATLVWPVNPLPLCTPTPTTAVAATSTATPTATTLARATPSPTATATVARHWLHLPLVAQGDKP